MRKRIIIIGAGVGGLTVAHELSKYPNYDIEIYEKKSQIGGLARSERDENGCITEYCWRVFFGFYYNLLQILSEIPVDSTHSVINNLTPYKHLNLTEKSSLSDQYYAILAILYGISSCDARLKNMDELSWWEALKTSSSSNLYREIGPWLGMDRYRGSYNSVIGVGMEQQIIPSYIDKNYRDYITTQSSSEAWFNHWYKHLIRQGVKINLNMELVDVDIKEGEIHGIYVNNKFGRIEKVMGDYYVFGLPVEMLDTIVNKTPKLQVGNLLKIKELKETCLHIQLSFQIYFNQEIKLENNGNAFLLIDAPWDIIVLSYDQAYQNTQLCQNMKNAKGGWSVAACTAYIQGIVYGKPMNECSYQEIITELWAQMMRSSKLKEMVKKNNGFEFCKEIVIGWSPMWKTYKYIDGKLMTEEPKFTNNAGSLKLRPSFKINEISNMYISTGYVKETIDIFSMEAACRAGKNVAYDISGGMTVKPIDIKRPMMFYPLRKMDEIYYKNKRIFIIGFFILGFLLFAYLIILIRKRRF